MRLTLRELARRLGVSHTAIRKAIRSGRLEQSIRYDELGRPFVADGALAAREWEANYDPSKQR
jgi:response regulator of citrate/malate metabolism